MKKGMFVGLILAGVISAVFGVLAPLHEIWHWLAAFLLGVEARIGWDITYITISEVTLFIGFAGMFGEITILTLLMIKLASMKYFKLSLYIFGYSASYIIALVSFLFLGFVPIDIEVMLGNYDKWIVYSIFGVFMFYYIFVLLLQIITINCFKTSIFPELFAKRVQEKLNYIEKKAKAEENKYKPLTLVK